MSGKNYAVLLQDLARTHGSKTALIDDAGTITFSGLADRTNRLAAGLSGLGVGPGDVVAIWLPNTIEWAEIALAAGRLGATALGVNTKLRSHDVQQLVAESGAKVLVTYPGFKGIDFLGMLADISRSAAGMPRSLTHIVHIRSAGLPRPSGPDGGTLVDYETLLEGDAACPTAPGGAAELPAHAFTSSGSTGRPKIILHNQRGLLFHGHEVAGRFGYDAQDAVVFGALPLCGVFGFNTLMAALAAGRPLVLQSVFNPEDALSLVEKHQITHMNLSDTMLRMMLDALADPGRVASWREAAFGNFTATDPMDMIRTGEQLGKKFFQTYGSSEVMALMTYPEQGSTAGRWALGGGVPVSEDIEVRIRDADTGLPVAAGAHGEIEVRGPNLSIGVLTADGIRPQPLGADGFLGTGDLGYLRTARDVVYLARMGDALRLGGFLVSPREVEAFLGGLTGVFEAQYVAVGGPNGLVPVAFVIVDKGENSKGSITEEDIIAACRARLAAFKVPRRVLIVDNFPMVRGANGDKVQRNTLREFAYEHLYGRAGNNADAASTSGKNGQRV